MIKLTGFERDPQNKDNVLATIEYDINEVPQLPFVVDAPMLAVDPMTVDEIKDYLKNKVAVQRGDSLWNSIENKLDGIKNVDLEA